MAIRRSDVNPAYDDRLLGPSMMCTQWPGTIQREMAVAQRGRVKYHENGDGEIGGGT
jgi:hypothetical protein